MTSPCASQKQTSQSKGFSMRTNVLFSSVTCAVHFANRTHCAGHVEFHTHVRVKNPSVPNSSTQPGLCPSAGSATSTACVSGPDLTLAAVHAGSRPLHSTDHPHAAVQTRDGPNCNYRRYPAFVPPLSQSSSPFDSRTHTPSCHETHSAFHYTPIHPGRRGCMLVHGDRHLPSTQRPHTRCHSPNTRSLTHSCLTH